MKNLEFIVKYILLMVAQVLIWNWFNFSQFLMIAFLPAMIFCLPVSRSSSYAMVLAFVTGMTVDFLSSGMMGLTSLALVPAALCRRLVIESVFGSEIFERGEDISFLRLGKEKIVMAITILTALFLAIWIIADGAGTRPLWISLAKFGASLLVSVPVSIFIAELLCAKADAKWR